MTAADTVEIKIISETATVRASRSSFPGLGYSLFIFTQCIKTFIF